MHNVTVKCMQKITRDYTFNWGNAVDIDISHAL